MDGEGKQTSSSGIEVSLAPDVMDTDESNKWERRRRRRKRRKSRRKKRKKKMRRKRGRRRMRKMLCAALMKISFQISAQSLPFHSALVCSHCASSYTLWQCAVVHSVHMSNIGSIALSHVILALRRTSTLSALKSHDVDKMLRWCRVCSCLVSCMRTTINLAFVCHLAAVSGRLRIM